MASLLLHPPSVLNVKKGQLVADEGERICDENDLERMALYVLACPVNTHQGESWVWNYLLLTSIQ